MVDSDRIAFAGPRVFDRFDVGAVRGQARISRIDAPQSAAVTLATAAFPFPAVRIA
jgi:hypothetical protein